MKGNQGLEALAALCGGRPKAVDTAGGSAPAAVASATTSGTGTVPSSPARTSPQTMVTSLPAVKLTAPVAAAAAPVATNQILMGQPGSGNASMPTQHVAPDALAASGAAALGLTPQQLSQAIVAATNLQGGRVDPALAQSLFYPAALRGAANGVDSVATATPIPGVQAAPTNNILASTMQQLVLQQYLQAQANAHQQQVQQQQQAQAQAAAAATSGHTQAALLAMTLAAGKACQGQAQQHFLSTVAPAPSITTPSTTSASTNGGASDPHRSGVAPSGAKQQQQQQQQAQAQAQVLLQHAAQQQQQQQQQLNNAGFTAIKPANAGMHQHAQAIQQQYHFSNGTPAGGAAGATANLPSMIKIAAAGGRILPSAEPPALNPVAVRPGVAMKDGTSTNTGEDSMGNKKQQKRAANRRSAQLSRKRKKQFIEELKEENDDLRRKEQILRAIPDLIVVFDSSGRLGFVSESVGRFLDLSPDELEGTSFWDLICDESVRMLKAAFMDSLAAREADSDTAVLGSGVWELRLKDKNSNYMIVTLNGVVHFKGDAPECVCCIRPLGGEQQQQQEQQTQDQQQKQSTTPSNQQVKADGLENAKTADGADKPNKNVNRAVSCSDGDASRSSDGSNRTQQSILNSRLVGLAMSSEEQDEAANDAKKRNKKFRRLTASAEDGEKQNSSSNNSINNNNVEADGTNNSVRISDADSNDGIESD